MQQSILSFSAKPWRSRWLLPPLVARITALLRPQSFSLHIDAAASKLQSDKLSKLWLQADTFNDFALLNAWR